MSRAGATPKNFGSPKPNRLINGLMDVTQRSGQGFISSTITTSQTIKIQDRWLVYLNNAGFFTSAIQGPTTLTNPTTGVVRSALNFSSQASNASANGFVGQRIEAAHIKDLAGKKLSLSFLIRNTNFTTVQVKLYYPTALDNFASVTLFHTSATQVFTANSTVKLVKFENITGDASLVNGMYVEIIYSGFSVGVADDTALSEVMVNEGTFAAPFIPFSGWNLPAEIQACKRYAEVGRFDAYTGNGSTAYVGGHIHYGGLKRTSSPILTIVDGAGNVGKITYFNSATGAQTANNNFTTTSSNEYGHTILLTTQPTSYGLLWRFLADAEL